MEHSRLLKLLSLLVLTFSTATAQSMPMLADPGSGTLSLLVQNAGELPRVDGLAMDRFGNLFAALETANPDGGVVYVDKQTGAVTGIAIGITGSDQIEFDSTGALYVTNEFTPAQTTGRLFKVDITYDAGNIPIGGDFKSVTTDLGINNPEGLIALPADGAFGSQGRLYIAEDASPGRILSVDVDVDANPLSGTVNTLVDIAADLRRPEGMAFGDFNGLLAPALYVAETSHNNILKINESGGITVFGIPTAVGLTNPDNVEFGPDGFLYVGEDPVSGPGRIIRIDEQGNHSVFATGFSSPAGLVFDPFSGDLFISEQDTQSIWRVTFAAQIPTPGSLILMAIGLTVIYRLRRRHTVFH